MLTPPKSDGVPVRTILPSLGFAENWAAWTDEPPGFVFDFGNLLLSANELVSMSSIRRVFVFGGVWRASRTIGSIEFEMRLTVESREQGVAGIVQGIGLDFVPLRPVPWFEEGKTLQDHLPWVRTAKLYAARPRCTVARDWMRLALRKLRTAAADAGPNDTYEIAFDGRVLLFSLPHETIAVPVRTGTAWPAAVVGRLHALADLPTRLMTDALEVSIWEEQLRIGNRAIALTPAGTLGPFDEASGSPATVNLLEALSGNWPRRF